jgi:hypothetical protein
MKLHSAISQKAVILIKLCTALDENGCSASSSCRFKHGNGDFVDPNAGGDVTVKIILPGHTQFLVSPI